MDRFGKAVHRSAEADVDKAIADTGSGCIRTHVCSTDVPDWLEGPQQQQRKVVGMKIARIGGSHEGVLAILVVVPSCLGG
jgi:hypothetical protein